MTQSSLYKILVCNVVVFLLIFGSCCFSVANWNYVTMGRLSYFIYGGILVWSFFSVRRLPSFRLPLLPVIIGMLTLCLPCILSIYIIHGESPLEEFKYSVIPIFSILIFILLYAYRISPKMLMKYITVVGLVIFVIQMIQILFPDVAIFGIYSEDELYIARSSDEISEIRNGLHRYRLESFMITLLCLYYYWDEFLKRKNINSFIIFIIFLVSLYFYLTRQLMLSAIVTLLLSFFFLRKKDTKTTFLVFAIIGLAALLKFSSFLFANLFENAESELTMDNIRVAAFAYFLSEIFSGPLQFLFGNGHPSILMDLQESMKIFSTDVGIVGQWYHFGVFWIILYFVSLYVLLVKHRKKIPVFAKLFLLSTLFVSPLIFPYRSAYEFVIWAVVLYICSYSIFLNASVGKKRLYSSNNAYGNKKTV